MNRLIVLFFIIFTVLKLDAQNYISVPDTLIQRGIDNNIPIKGNFDSYNEISIGFEFNPNVIEIKDFIYNNNTKFNLIDFYIEKESNSLWRLNLTAGNNSDTDSDILIYFVIEGLVSSELQTDFLPVNIIADGEEPIVEIKPGIIFVSGNPIFPGDKEVISPVYPNPFYYDANIDIKLTQQTNLEFKLYDSFGKFLRDFNDSDFDKIQMRLFNEGNIIENPENLEPGNYRLVLTPNNTLFASGIYYLFIRSNTGNYIKKFIYQK